MTAARPFTLLIAALGGEGGGLLTDWIVEACRAEDMPVQTTSIPGVAQRTGATTYYIEMMPAPEPGAPEPLFGLYPAPGYIDMAVASEMIEAGRLIEMGFVTPDRTTLIASNHRVFSMDERIAMGDGSYQTPRIADAARALAAHLHLKDFAALAKAERTAINAVLLGAISASDDCPIPTDAFETAITARGVAPDANLRGFNAGRSLVLGEIEAPAAAEPAKTITPTRLEALHNRADTFSDETRDVIHAGIDRLLDYQDAAYAELYLDRLQPIAAADAANDRRVTRETARYLALWMAYEDVIRVADLKTRSTRFARVRSETGAKPDEPVQVTEFLKPGIEELATILPAGLGRALTTWAERRGLADRLHIPLHVRTDTVFGFTLVRLIARLKGRRRKGLRYLREQEMITGWLDGIEAAAKISPALAAEWAECGRIIKGYSETRQRANRNFGLLRQEILTPALDGGTDPDAAAPWLKAAREAALADEDGKALGNILVAGPTDAGPKQAAE